MPQMAKRMTDSQYQGVVQVPEMMGEIDSERVGRELEAACEAQRKGNSSSVVRLKFPTLLEKESEEGRRSLLKETGE